MVRYNFLSLKTRIMFLVETVDYSHEHKNKIEQPLVIAIIFNIVMETLAIGESKFWTTKLENCWLKH